LEGSRAQTRSNRSVAGHEPGWVATGGVRRGRPEMRIWQHKEIKGEIEEGPEHEFGRRPKLCRGLEIGAIFAPLNAQKRFGLCVAMGKGR